nr:putative ribonuclease H-like domain-containing protein [Tanacetum cinerariifolium]
MVPFHTKKLFTTLQVNSPSFFGRIVPLFDTILIQQGAGSGTPTEPHHTPSLEAPPSLHTYISLPSLPTVTPISTAPIPTVTPSETTPLRQYTRRARIAQSSALPPVADESASPVRDVSQRESCPTESGFIVDQDRTTIAKFSTLPYDSATRVTSPAAVKGSMQQTINELTEFHTRPQRQHSELLVRFQAQEVEINKLKERVKLLEDGKGMAAEGSRDDAPIKRRRLDKEEVATKRVSSDTEEIRLDEGEVAAEKVSDDTEELATVLITIDAASVLSSGGVHVVPTAAAVAPANVSISTGSGVVPTASTTISTATPIFATATTVTPYTRRKGKEKMVETHTPKKKKRVQEQIDIQFAKELEEELEREAQRMNAQISRDEEIAKIHPEEELQQMIAGLDRSNETIAKHLEEYDQAAAELTIEERIELISELVKYQDHHSKILKFTWTFFLKSKDETSGILKKFITEIENLKNLKVKIIRGYVSFGQGGCKITRKGTIKTGKLEFENVYFVKYLKYNLFSVSQIYDNKNNVLFTDSKCIVLGRDFKLLDDANILLRAPRQHNMYSIDLNNIIPHRDLTCLIAKASADECMLWHKRLGFVEEKVFSISESDGTIVE